MPQAASGRVSDHVHWISLDIAEHAVELFQELRQALARRRGVQPAGFEVGDGATLRRDGVFENSQLAANNRQLRHFCTHYGPFAVPRR